MKKLVLILIVVLALTLSGCNGEYKYADEQEVCTELGDGYYWEARTLRGIGCKESKAHYNARMELLVNNETYYTQEEVDSLLRQQSMEIYQDLMKYYIQSYDGKLYTNCRIEDSIKVCDEIILN